MELIGKVHPIPVLSPQDEGTSSDETDVVGLQEYNHVTFLVHTGTLAGTCDMTVEECTANDGSDASAIGFNYREMETVDTWGDLTSVDSGGLTIAADDDDQVFAIEIDADELSDGYPYVRVALGAPSTGSNYYSVMALMSEPRYMKDVPVSAVD